jgi:hypothetical protein
VTRGRGNMRIFRQIWHFSKVLVVWGTGVEVLAVFGAKMVFFPRLIFIISIISHNFSKIFFFNLKNLTFIFITPIIIHNFSYNLIISNHFLSLKNIFFLISKFNTQTHIKKESEFYSTSKHIFIISKFTNRFRILFIFEIFNTQT